MYLRIWDGVDADRRMMQAGRACAAETLSSCDPSLYQMPVLSRPSTYQRPYGHIQCIPICPPLPCLLILFICTYIYICVLYYGFIPYPHPSASIIFQTDVQLSYPYSELF
jgi:hypothetical protein